MTSKINLRKLSLTDASRLSKLIDNHKVVDNLRNLPSPYLEKDAVEFIVRCINPKNENLIYAIDYEGEFCGVIGFYLGQDVYSKAAEIGYWLGEPYWGKGIMSEVVKQATSTASSQLGVVRMWAGVFSYNKSSMKVLEKNGFHLESIAKNKVFKLDKIWDEYVYVKLVD